MTDIQFKQTRKALQSKQRDLKRKGKGNKSNASAASSEEDIQVLYEKHLLGSSTAEALLNTVWFKAARSTEKYVGRRKTFSNFHRAGIPRIQ